MEKKDVRSLIEKKSNSNPVIKFSIMYIVLGLALFLPAGTIFWLEAWIYLAIFITYSINLMFYLKKNDPELLKSRTKFKTEVSWDKKISSIGAVFMIAMYIMPGFDVVRFQWSHIPLYIELVGFIGIILSLLTHFLVIKENTFLSRVVEIQKDRGHKVITTGPYRIIRHPMYLGVIFMYICHCIALGSLYALIPCIGVLITIVLRTYYEDKMLHEQLPGYKEYAEKTRYRLIPGVW